jgi:hypothetical protein
MGKKKKNSKVREYRHDEKRKNNPPIGMVNYVLALFALRYAPCLPREIHISDSAAYFTGALCAMLVTPLGLCALCAMRYALCLPRGIHVSDSVAYFTGAPCTMPYSL